MTITLTPNTTEQDDGDWQPNNVDLPTDIAAADGIGSFPLPANDAVCVLGLSTVALGAGARVVSVNVNVHVELLQGAAVRIALTDSAGNPITGGADKVAVTDATGPGVSNISGQATFAVTLDQAGLDALCIKVIGRTTIPASGGAISVLHDVAVFAETKREVVYVEQSWNGGDDANPGTAAAPKETTASAMNDVAENGTLIFGDGTFAGQITIPNNTFLTVKGNGMLRTWLKTDPDAYDPGTGIINGSGVSASISDLTIWQNVADEYYCFNPNNGGDPMKKIDVRRVCFKYEGDGGFNAVFYGQVQQTSVRFEDCVFDSVCHNIFVEDGHLITVKGCHFRGCSGILLNGHNVCANIRENNFILTRTAKPDFAESLKAVQFAGQSAVIVDNVISNVYESGGADTNVDYAVFDVISAGGDSIGCLIDRNAIAIKPFSGSITHLAASGVSKIAMGRQQWFDPAKVTATGGASVVMADEMTPAFPARPVITVQRADNLDNLDAPVSDAGGSNDTIMFQGDDVTIS